MKTGILCSRGSVDRIVKKGVEAERQGFDFFGVGDTQNLFPELYVSLGGVASATSEIDVGPVVTNPVTRHQAVTASAMCTANQLAHGRVFMGLGSGDSAVRSLGKRPATIQEIENLVRHCRRLWRGDATEIGGESMSLRWVDDATGGHGISLRLSAGGPKTLRLAGRVADGVFVAWGLTDDVVERAVEHVEAGARDVGRDPDEVAVYVWAKSNFADDRATAVNEMRMQLASTANHALRFDLAEKAVPEEYRDPIRQLQDAYEPAGHLGLEADNPNSELVERFGLTDYLADRFTVAGTVEDVADQLAAIEAIDGVDGVLFTADTANQLKHIRTLGTQVFPLVDW
jgi:5,10-methylenetetrahydromethanopterin reductase